MKCKKHIALALMLTSFVFASVAFGQEEPKYKPGERTEALVMSTLNPALHPVFVIYKTNYNEMNNKKEETLYRHAFKGMNFDNDIKAASGHIQMQFINKVTYYIDHNERTYWKHEMQPQQVPVITGQVGKEEEVPADAYHYEIGKEKIKGVEYDYEDRVYKQSRTRYYYAVDTADWKYEKSGKQLKEVVDYGCNVKAEWFTIPAGYTEVPSPMAAATAQINKDAEVRKALESYGKDVAKSAIRSKLPF